MIPERSSLVIDRLNRSQPPDRRDWPMLVPPYAPSVYSEASTIRTLVTRHDGSFYAAGICVMRRGQRTISRAEWDAWKRWRRRWVRWHHAYWDWRVDGNREQRRQRVKDARKRGKAQRQARKRTRVMS